MTDRLRARSFGAVAAQYSQHRPGYPDEALDLALPPGRAPGRVLDLGAGTGLLTAALLARTPDVVAVEPDPEMLTRLRTELPGADAHEGSAESIPLPSGSVDAVLAGQALHWFDLTRAAPEMARLLRPGGVLAGLWNSADPDAGWTHELGAVAGSVHPPNPRGAGRDVAMPGAPSFGPAERAEVRWRRPMTVESYLADVATHSWALTAAPAERDAAFARMRSYLAARPETSSGRFELPMVTVVWRTLRR